MKTIVKWLTIYDKWQDKCVELYGDEAKTACPFIVVMIISVVTVFGGIAITVIMGIVFALIKIFFA